MWASGCKPGGGEKITVCGQSGWSPEMKMNDDDDEDNNNNQIEVNLHQKRKPPVRQTDEVIAYGTLKRIGWRG